MKFFSQFVALIFVAGTPAAVIAQQKGENVLSPVLALSIPKPAVVPLVDDSLRDPAIENRNIAEEGQVSALIKENKVLRQQLKAIKGPGQVKLAVQMMENHAAIAYYYADRFAGKFGPSNPKKFQALMTSAYQDLIEYATVVQSLSKTAEEVAVASYHIHSASYIMNTSQEKNLELLRALVTAGGKLPERLQSRGKMFFAILDLNKGNAEAAAIITPLLNSVGTVGGTAARLSLARLNAGIDGRGEKVGEANPDYQKLLFAASDKAFSVGVRSQEKILDFVLGVWRSAEGPKASWKKPPFNEERFRGQSKLLAIKERDGIWEWTFGTKREAIKIYSELSKELKAKPIANQIDKRILDLEEALYIESKNPTGYERSLGEMRKRYDDEKSLGRDIEQEEKVVRNLIEKRHRALVEVSLLGASSPQATEKSRVEAINLANRFLAIPREKPTADSEQIEAQIAGLWVLNKNYQKAVDLYLKLAKSAKGPPQEGFYAEAIKSQSILAKWPLDPPWMTAVPAENGKERKKLLQVYESLNLVRKGKTDWVIVGHIGQLNLNLNQVAAAFKIWDDAIHKSAEHPAAALASGIMLNSYLQKQDWQRLEDLARFNLLAKMQPTFNKAPLNPGALLPLALVKGADAAYKTSKFLIAAKKYKELLAKFSSKDDDYAYFMLANSYRGAEKHKTAVDTLVDFSEKFQKSSYFRQALINGGNWSVPLAYEENAMYFFKEFLKYFPTDPEAQRIVDSLASIYLGRRLYAEATALFQQRIASQQVSDSVKVTAALQLMRVEFAYGSKDRAYQAADLLLKLNPPADIKAESAAMKARSYYSIRNVAGLEQLDLEIKSLGNSAAIMDSLGEIRYLMAEAKLGPMFQSVNSHRVINPVQAVFDRVNLFNKIQPSYHYVCSNGHPSMCGPAMHRLAGFADRMVELIQGFEIPATLEEKEISDFMKKKAGIIANLRKTSVDLNRRAAAAIENGHTNPDWTNQILWKNSKDWNFDNVTGTTGNGFIQWTLDNKS